MHHACFRSYVYLWWLGSFSNLEMEIKTWINCYRYIACWRTKLEKACKAYTSFAVSPSRFSFRPFPKKRPILKLPDYDYSTRIPQVSHFRMLFSCWSVDLTAFSNLFWFFFPSYKTLIQGQLLKTTMASESVYSISDFRGLIQLLMQLLIPAFSLMVKNYALFLSYRSTVDIIYSLVNGQSDEHMGYF